MMITVFFQKLGGRALLASIIIAAIAVLFASIAQGQQPGPVGPIEEDERGVVRVLSITWDGVTHRMKFAVQEGACSAALFNGGCKPENVTIGNTFTYEIDPDNGVMIGEKGPNQFFAQQEAQQIHRILDFLDRYALESHKWFKEGKGLAKPGQNFVRRPLGPGVGAFTKKIVATLQ